MSSRGDIAVAIGFVLVGVAIIIGASGIAEGSVQDPIGTGGMPTAIGIVVAVLGTAIALRRLVQMRRTGQTTVEPEGAIDEPEHPVAAWRPLVAWILALIYVIALPWLGYLILTPLLVGSLLWIMAIRDRLILLGVSFGFTLVAFGLFQLFLRVDLP